MTDYGNAASARGRQGFLSLLGATASAIGVWAGLLTTLGTASAGFLGFGTFAAVYTISAAAHDQVQGNTGRARD